MSNQPLTASNDVDLGYYEGKLLIDKNDLDQELIEQVQHYYAVCERLADARSIRDQVKDDLKSLEADLALSIRADRETKGDKLTEAALAQHVQMDKWRQKKFKRLLNADHELNRWEALKEAFYSRGYMLRQLVELHISQYFQRDSVSSTDTMKAEYDAEINKAKMAQMRRERSR